MSQKCKPVIDHISRIQGQFETLKKYISEEQPCEKVVQLAASVLKSCNSLKAKLAEGYIIQELLNEDCLSATEKNQLENLSKLIKI